MPLTARVVRRRCGRVGAADRRHLLLHDLRAHGTRAADDRRVGDPLDVVREELVRAGAREAVASAVRAAASLDAAGQPADRVHEGRRDAAGTCLHEADVYARAFDAGGVMVAALLQLKLPSPPS